MSRQTSEDIKKDLGEIRHDKNCNSNYGKAIVFVAKAPSV